MSSVIKSRLIKIGNSQGVRIPKILLDQMQWGNEIEMEVLSDRIVLRPVRPIRHGWDRAFQLMHDRGDDDLLDAEIPHELSSDGEEWEW